jgi:hypothetical protein
MQFCRWLARCVQYTFTVQTLMFINITITLCLPEEEVAMTQSVTRGNFDDWMMPVYAPAPFIRFIAPYRGTLLLSS